MNFPYRRPPREIRPFFDEQFSAENVRREQQRAGLLAVLFGAGMFFALSFYLYVSRYEGFNPRLARILFVFLTGITLYETSIWNFLRFQRQSGRELPRMFKFANAFVEISALTLALYFVSPDFSSPVLVMLSPVASVYFLFIILSTLRLSFAVSLFTGAVAGVEFLLLSLYLLERGGGPEFLYNLPFTYAGKAEILLLAGVAAGYVARQIQKSLRSSIEALEEQNQLITLFGQQVSPEIAQVMLDGKGRLESQRMRVAVLFLDIRDFTRYADKHTAEDIVAYQNAFFGLIVEEVNRCQGIVNQFLGDGCMVTFGAPVPLDNPAENAVEAAMNILKRVPEKTAAGLLPPTLVGIGVHVGEAVTGNIGTEARRQYNITGSVVIQASRIEQLNKDYNSQLLISEDVYESLPDKPEAQPVGAVHLKGMEQEVFVWKLA